MEILVVIVDDTPNLAKLVERAVTKFQSTFNEITYRTVVISGINVYQDAKNYILNNQSNIDILLVDFNLETHLKGIELFKLIDSTKYRIYKILVSITAKSQYATKGYFKTLYDDFRYSKDENDIIEALRLYESEILSVKLWGNPAFHDKYFINDQRLTDAAKKRIFGVQYFDILFAQTDGKSKEEVTFFFRDPITRGISTLKKTELTIKKFNTTDLFFRRISPSAIVNLLWVAKIYMHPNINTRTNKIRFITKDNSIAEFDFIFTDCFEKEAKPSLPQIDDIPPFFRD